MKTLELSELYTFKPRKTTISSTLLLRQRFKVDTYPNTKEEYGIRHGINTFLGCKNIGNTDLFFYQIKNRFYLICYY